MPFGELFDEPTDTRQELMGATYRALCEHGYAALTIQRISDQFSKSKSLLYHHYDSKDELLVDFLSFILDHLESSTPPDDGGNGDPLAALQQLLDHLLPTEPSTEQQQFMQAIIELRAQAATNPEYRAQFTRSTEFFQDQFAVIIERGHREGVFRAVDADRLAAFVVATVDGALLQQATTETTQPTIRELRAELETFLDCRLGVDTELTETDTGAAE